MPKDYYEKPTIPRTMANWKSGLLVNDQSTLKKRATEGDLDAEAQLKALKHIRRVPQKSS